jgi:HD-GYP domain-containing protein (c-di-GMP phosphodiesterase class II)
VGSLYDSSITVIRNILEAVREGSEVDVQQLRRLSTQMVSAILDEPKKLFLVTTSHPDFREDLFDHSIDVAIVATSLAATLKRNREWLNEVMFCGLVHDIGKSVIPKEILYKPGKLDAGEWEIMMQHAQKGGEILYGIPGVGTLAPQVAFEHQAKYDLSGYPQLKYKKHLHPVTQLIIVADTYSALTAVRAYKKPFSPGRSLSIMEEMSGIALKPDLFNQFVIMTSFYKVGTQAKLFSGDIVTILKMDLNHVMRPVVHVDSVVPGSELNEGAIIDLTEKDPYSKKYKYSLQDTLNSIENVY